MLFLTLGNIPFILFDFACFFFLIKKSGLNSTLVHFFLIKIAHKSILSLNPHEMNELTDLLGGKMWREPSR